MSTSTRGTGVRFRVGTILIYLLSLLLVGSAVAKFAQIPKVASQMAAMGFDGNKLIFITLLEIASAILFVYPRTRSFGLLMVSAYLGGAIATHVGHNHPPFQPAVVLALFWLAAWLRHPEMLWSMNGTSS
jgi:DoxX-like family